MAVWPFLMGGAAVLLSASLFARNDWATRASMIVLSAYVLTQAKKTVFADDDLAFVVTAAIWVVASGAIPRQLGSNLTQNMVRVAAIRVCMAVSGLCYFWARIIDAPRVFGSAPYLTADLLLIAAMLLIGGVIGGDVIDRMRILARNVFGSRGGHIHSHSSIDGSDPT